MADKQKIPYLVIEIKGGLVQNVWASEPLAVRVMDWDNAESDEDTAQECQALVRLVQDKALLNVF